MTSAFVVPVAGYSTLSRLDTDSRRSPTRKRLRSDRAIGVILPAGLR